MFPVFSDNDPGQGTENNPFIARRTEAGVQNLGEPKPCFLKLVRGRKVNSDTEWDRK